MLDAPPTVLCSRKPDSDVDTLQARREEYLAAGDFVTRFEIVDATLDPDEVLDAARDLIIGHYKALRRPCEADRVVEQS